MKNRFLAASLIAMTLAGVACGSNASTKTTSTTVATNTSAAAGKTTFNGIDVEFAQNMIPHHEQAVEMAQLALDAKANAGAKVRDLATRIKGAQDPEIKVMTTWLAAWGEPTKADMGGHDMSSMSSTEGMMSAAEMAALGKATGAEFDRTWLTMMVAHHQGAIKMAQSEKAQGSNADARALADKIIAAQQTEITEMTKLLSA